MKRRGRWFVVAVIVLGAIAAVVMRTERSARLGSWWRRGGGAGAGATQPVVPAGTRVKVEVLNATDTKGLARSAAFFLRDAGFDVVYFGNTSERHDSTVVRDRSGHADWSAMARRAMSPAIVEVGPDSTRLVDLTVLVGSLWRPPPDPLRP